MSATGPVCAIVQQSLGDYLRDSLPAPQRKMLRDHLVACPECGGAAAASDPTLRFARPLSQTVSEAEAAEILAAVRTGVDLLAAQRRIGSGARRVRLGSAAAAVAAVILLSSGFEVLRSRRLPETGVVAAVAARPSPGAQPAPASAALQPAGLSEATPSSSEATVYDWNPGAGREEPRVVWIVDGGLDI